jgi:hypothetical protein
LEYLNYAPSADAFLYRLKMLDYDEAYAMMSDANDALIDTISRQGILKKRAIVAIDYKDSILRQVQQQCGKKRA